MATVVLPAIAPQITETRVPAAPLPLFDRPEAGPTEVPPSLPELTPRGREILDVLNRLFETSRPQPLAAPPP